MKVLVVCDDFYHPAHVVRGGLAPLEGDGITFDWIENAKEWSAEKIAAYPVAILSKSDNVSAANQSPWMTGETQQAWVDYVRQGHGLLAIHSGTAGYSAAAQLRSLLGGVFDHHPAQCPVTVEPVAGHALAAGCAPFTAVDEHYFMAQDDPQVDVFMRTVSEHGSQPGGWTRREGAGRVCVLTPGHNLEVWLQPSFQSLIRNTLKWCNAS